MKIWGRANSINVMKVLWCADECGVKYERTDVGGAFGGNDQKWYLDMNPNGVVPTVDDGGRVIWESNSAVRFLVLILASLNKPAASAAAIARPRGSSIPFQSMALSAMVSHRLS